MFDDSWPPLEKLYLTGIRTCVACAHGVYSKRSYFEVTRYPSVQSGTVPHFPPRTRRWSGAPVVPIVVLSDPAFAARAEQYVGNIAREDAC